MDAGRRRQLEQSFTQLLDEFGRGLDQLDLHGLRSAMQRSVDVQSWLAAFDAAAATAAGTLTVRDTPVDASNLVSGGGRRSRRECDAVVDRAAACTAVPGIGESLVAGDVATGHVDAVAAATRNLSDAAKERFAAHGDDLLDNARFDTPEEFHRRCRNLAKQVTAEDERLARQERLRRQRKVTRWTDHDGMCHTKLSLDPLADQQVWTTIEAVIAAARSHDQSDDDRTFDQLQADAVVDLLCRTGTNDALSRVPEICVHVDLDTLFTRAAADGESGLCETADGQPLPVETVRRLCCDGRILPVVLDGRGVPVDVGRSQRLATPAQRQALRSIHSTCAHPGCTVRFERCRIHHVRFWEHGGPTDLDNLVPLCSKHHHLVHEGGWTLSLMPDRHATWTSPTGATLHAHPDRLAPAEPTPATDRRADVRQMADAVARRRVATTESATRTTPRHRRDDDRAPLPLFAMHDTIARRGPPAAS